MDDLLDPKLDAEGIRWEHCTKCECYQFGIQPGSVRCRYGHIGLHYVTIVEIVVCSVKDGDRPCDCAGFRRSRLSSVRHLCAACEHEANAHNGNFPSDTIPNVVVANTNTAPDQIASNPMSSRSPRMHQNLNDRNSRFDDQPSILERNRETIRELARENRVANYGRSVERTEDRSTRGGFRPGAGRKILTAPKKVMHVAPVKKKMKGFTYERVSFMKCVELPNGFQISDLKSNCREIFKNSIESLSQFNIDLRDGKEEILRNLQGGKVADDASNVVKSFNKCYYYNSQFDQLSLFGGRGDSLDDASATERHSLFGEDGGTSSSRKRRLSGNRENESINSSTPGSSSSRRERVVMSTPGLGMIDGQRRESFIVSLSDDEANGMLEDMDLEEGESSSGVSNETPKNENTDTTYNEQILEISKAYAVDVKLVELIGEMENHNVNGVIEKLDHIKFGTEEEEPLRKLWKYFAFHIREHDDEFEDRIFLKLSWYDHAENSAERQGLIRDQIRLIWKDKLDEFHKRVSVVFDDAGRGPAVTAAYLDIVRKLLDFNFFEGQMDHKVPLADNTMSYMGEFEFCGKLMAHVAHEGSYVVGGLSPMIKFFIVGVPVNELPISINDIPDYDLQDIINKVQSGQTMTENEKRKLSYAILEASLERSNGVSYRNDADMYVVNHNKAEIAQFLIRYFALTKRLDALRQIAHGFNHVGKFTQFYEISGYEYDLPLATPLLKTMFPTESEMTVTKEKLGNSIELIGGTRSVKQQLNSLLDGIIAQLTEDIQCGRSTSQFIQMCTANSTLKEMEKIKWHIKPRREMKKEVIIQFNVCFKEVLVDEEALQSEVGVQQLEQEIWSNIKSIYQKFNSA